jgi:hypothetical protein
MDELSSKINEIMSDPNKLKEIQNLGKMMGLTGENKEPQQKPIENNSTQTETGFTGIDPNLLGKIAPILNSINKEDNTTKLFDALAPFLSEERKKTLEKIRKMLILYKLLPHIKNLGLFF